MKADDYEVGKLLEVTLVTLGSELEIAAGIGALTLQVYDSSDFSDDGGSLKIFVDPGEEATEELEAVPEESYILAYSSKDDETNIITLLEPVPVAIEEETAVYTEPRSVEKWASVQLDPNDDAIYARIPYTLSVGVEEGIRPIHQKDSVLVQLQGTEYVVVDFLGEEEYIDPSQLPPGPVGPAGPEGEPGGAGPGVPITTAPTLEVEPGFRSFLVHHDQAVSGTDQVYYELHMSETGPNFTASAATLYTTGTSFIVHISETTTGQAIRTDQPYYFKARAYTTKVVGPWSNEVIATAVAGLDPLILADLNNNILPTVDTKIATVKTQMEAFTNGKFPIGSTQILDDAITTPKIYANAITASEVNADAIYANMIAANQVTANEIAANSIYTNMITANQVNADKITTNAIIAEKIAADAVTANKIFAGSIVTAHLAVGAVIADRIAAGAISANHLAANSVTAVKIAAGALTVDKIAPNYGADVQFPYGLHATTLLAQTTITGGSLSVTAAISGNTLSLNQMATAQNFTATGQTGGADIAAVIGSGGLIKRSGSSREIKQDFTKMTYSKAQLLALQHSIFRKKDDPTGPFYAGFISEEAEELGLEEWVARDEKGKAVSFHYDAWTAALQVICQGQQEEIDELRDIVTQLQNAA